MAAFKFQHKFHVRAAPCVNGLIRVTHHEQILVVSRQNIRQLVLILVNVLKFIDHGVFQPLLPLFPHLCVLPQAVERKIDDIVKVEAVAFALLIEIPVHDLVLERVGRRFQLPQALWVHIDERAHIAAPALAPANVVDGVLDGHIPRGDAQLLKNSAQHRRLVLLVQNDEGGGILQDVAVLLQKPHAEAMERRDERQVLIGQDAADALFHLGGRLVRKRDAEDIRSRDAERLHQIQIACGQRFRLAGASARDHADIALRRFRSLALRGVQRIQKFQSIHSISPSLYASALSIAHYMSNIPDFIGKREKNLPAAALPGDCFVFRIPYLVRKNIRVKRIVMTQVPALISLILPVKILINT